MPFKSKKQQKYLWMKHPKIAARWTRKYGSFSKRKKRSKRKRKKG